MAARHVLIGQYPDYRDEIRGTLLEILASTANPGTYAVPEDVAGCTLEMGADGLWTGASVGTLTQAQADALVASGAMAKVKAGTPGTIGENGVLWNGVGVVSSGNLVFTDSAAATAWATANPSLVYDGLMATIGGSAYIWTDGAWVVQVLNPTTAMGTGFSMTDILSGNKYIDSENSGPAIMGNKFVLDSDGTFASSALYFVSKVIPVLPGKKFTLYLATAAVTNMGCYYLNGNFVSPVSASFANGVYVVPEGVNEMRLTVEKAVPAAQRWLYFCGNESKPYSGTIRRITFNGDSITAKALTNIGYTEIVAERISAAATTNLGVPASTYTAPGYTPLYTRNSQIPGDTDVLVMLGGTNDYGLFAGGAPLGVISDSATTTFYGAVNTCIEYAIKAIPNAKIVICTPTRRGSDAIANGQGLILSDYCAAIIASAKKYGVRVADLYNDAIINPSIEQHARMFYNSDKLHPNENGHYRIADCICRALQ